MVKESKSNPTHIKGTRKPLPDMMINGSRSDLFWHEGIAGYIYRGYKYLA